MMYWQLKTGFLALCATVLTACGGGGDSGSSESSQYDNQPNLTLPNAQVLCGSQGLNPKVINGATCTAPHSSPVIVLGIQKNGGTATCSGILVTPSAIVTAAHCVEGAARIGAAQWTAEGSATWVLASRWARHPRYSRIRSADPRFNGAPVGDLAVVHLNGTLSNPTMAILTSQPTTVGQSVYVSGWGAPVNMLAVGMARVEAVEGPLIGFVYDGKLSSACPGDSGGPLYRMVHGRMGAVAVTSFGSGGCAAGSFSFFANLQEPLMLGFLRAQIPGLPEI